MSARKVLGSLAFALVLGSPAVFAQSVTEQAAAHVEAGRFAAAYALLAPQESERAGDPQFDLLLGISALETGRHTLAVFALERVLAVQPDNARARAEIGRAYMELGESAGARRELQAVRSQKLPPEVAASIDRLLSAIERAPEASKSTFGGYIEAAVGRDSNVNSATADGTVAVPGFGDFRLSGSSKRRDAWFSALSGGANARIPVSREWAVVGGVSGAARFNFGESRFDTDAVDGYAGAAWSRGANRVTAVLQLGLFEVDNSKLRDYSGMSLQWQHTHDARNQTTVFAQHARLRYEGGNDVRDANRTLFGLGHAVVLPNGQTMLYGSFYLGREIGQNRLPSGADIAGNDLIGVRFGAQHQFDRNWLLFGSFAHESREYQQPDPVFLATREDDLMTLSLGVTYALTDAWQLTPSVTLIRNESTLKIDDYRRGIAQFAVRRTF